MGWLLLLAEPTSAPRGSREVFLRSQDGGPSHMGEQPQLAGFPGQPAVWGLGVRVAWYGCLFRVLESRGDSGGDGALVQQQMPKFLPIPSVRRGL